jgi:hypothetical protein
MLLRTTFTIWIFLFSLYGAAVLAQAKTTNKESKPSAKPWANLDGFRSAKFGMNQGRVMRALAKDFKISKSKVKIFEHHVEKTLTLSVNLPDLLGSTAGVSYILGQKSKELIQVNVIWGYGADKNSDGQDSVNTANKLRDHFLKKRYKDKSLATNVKLGDKQMLVFRGRDKKDRMVLLLLTKHEIKMKGAKEATSKMTLKLSYMLDFNNPDVFSIKEGEF